MRYQKIIDIHAHIWGNNYKSDKSKIIKACRLYNISKVYISGLGSHYPDDMKIDELNFKVSQFMKEEPDIIEGLCYINPNNNNSMDILKKNIEEYEMSGMKLWVATFCDDPKVFPLVERCIYYKIPILIHSFKKSVGQLKFESTGVNVAKLAKRYPEAKIIMAHLGGNCYHGIKAIRNYSNVSVDISGSQFRGDDLYYARKEIGAKRILFGTDMPGSFLVNVGQVNEADITLEEKNLIYYRNAIRLFEKSEVNMR